MVLEHVNCRLFHDADPGDSYYADRLCLQPLSLFWASKEFGLFLSGSDGSDNGCLNSLFCDGLVV